jgi:hypothetical protein
MVFNIYKWERVCNLFVHAEAKAERLGVLNKQREVVMQEETVCLSEFYTDWMSIVRRNGPEYK